MGKKPSKGGDFWEGLSGWKSVEVGDALLLGADEYGFSGLEELHGSAIGDFVVPGGGPEAVPTEPAEQQQQQQPPPPQQAGQKRKQPEAAADAEAQPGAKGKEKKKKTKKKGKDAAGTAAAAGGEAAGTDGALGEGGVQPPDSVDALKQQLAAVTAENKQLKKQQKKEARLEKRTAGAAKRKEDKAAKRAAATQAAVAAAETAAAAAPRVNMEAWRELELHPAIEGALAALNFAAPTHVQAECLPAAVRDRRDIIGAAQTGSGKTLAFGLPIMQLLVQERQAEQRAARKAAGAAGAPGEGAGEGAGAGAGASGGAGERDLSSLRALVLAPTRELALQVCEHLQAVGKSCGVWVVPIVGGISALKQERMLAKQPEVIVATPGRLWDLMREGHAHLTNFSRLSFLVIDEADRMVQQGHYGELSSILGAIPTHQQLATPEAEEPEDEGPAEHAEHAVVAAGDEEALAAGSEEEGSEDGEEGEGEEGGRQQPATAAAPGDQEQGQRQRGNRMQTFVFSATLTLPSNLRMRLRKGGGGASGSTDLDGLMDQIPFRGKPKIVDLTSKSRLADKITEAYLSCGETERDEYLYCLLAKHPGRTIVFVNAISSVRRLAALLKLLGLPTQQLHAGMQQKQRLKALDRFKAETNSVLVATDVAARGLDVKDVRCVVHYQLPASVDTYVHRSGRTARGDAEGLSIALVTPKENGRFLALLKAMKRDDPPQFPLDTSLLPAVHRRVRLAIRLDELERKQSKGRAEKSWRRQHAEELGIELSDDSEDDEVEGRRQGKGSKRERGGKRGPEEMETAAEVRAELASLLSEPLQPKYSSKWFTGGAAASVMAAVDPSAPSTAASSKKKKQQAQQRAVAAAAAAAGGDGEALGGDMAAEAQPKTMQTVHKAVALAQARSDSRGKVAEQAAAKQRRNQQRAQQAAAQQGAIKAAQAQPGKAQQQAEQAEQQGAGKAGGKAAGKGKNKKPTAGDVRAAALQAALNKALYSKQRRKAGPGGRGMLVIPHALGREAGGPDALQALRNKLGTTQ